MLSQRWRAPATVAHTQRALAVVQGGAEGIRLFEGAAEMLSDSPRRNQRAHALVDLGEARIAKRAHAELQATGEKVRRYTPIGAESLPPSERRVAGLAASGMTNRQIAQSLFVTIKTVEAHLRAVYDKLDIDGRGQIAAALA